MKRFFGLFAVIALLLSACGGGGVRSPDFLSQLVGLEIQSTAGNPVTGVQTLAPSATLQLKAMGLYSQPPGASSATKPGAVDGVQWASSAPTIASVDANGLVRGLKRNATPVTITLSKAGQTSVSVDVKVDGPVMKELVVTVVTPSPATHVPVGRTFGLTVSAKCSANLAAGSTTTACSVASAYTYSWVLDALTPAGSADAPAPVQGQSTQVKTKKFVTASNPIKVNVSAVNEEGDTVPGSINLTTDPAVIDSIVVVEQQGAAEPIAIARGTQKILIAKGVFSSGETRDITAADLKSGTKLSWAKDASAVGDVTLSDQTATTAPNNTIVVSGVTVGATGVTATGQNNEATARDLSDRAAINVVTANLVKLTSAVPANGAAARVINGGKIQYVAMGIFTDEPTAKQVDPVAYPLDWATVDGTGKATVDTAGLVTGTAVGTVTVSASLQAGVANGIVGADRTGSGPLLVTDAVCTDPFLQATGATAASAVDTSVQTFCLGCAASNSGNVIDANVTNFGSFTIGPNALMQDGHMSMTFVRPSSATVSGQKVGVVIKYDSTQIDAPEQIITVTALNGATDVTNGATSLTTFSSGNVGYVLAQAPVKLGTVDTVKIDITMLSLLNRGPGALSDLLSLGGSANIDVYSACAATQPPPAAP